MSFLDLATGPLILASESPYKRALLEERLGLTIDVQAAHLDESRLCDESPIAMARRLAIAKARAIADEHPNAWVIASDQVPALGERIFGKPGSTAAAVEQLMSLQGKPHQLITALCLIAGDQPMQIDAVVMELEMRPLSRHQIEAYVDLDTPLDCAGSYKFERAGAALFSSVSGPDPTSIQGLPLLRLCSLLQNAANR